MGGSHSRASAGGEGVATDPARRAVVSDASSSRATAVSIAPASAPAPASAARFSAPPDAPEPTPPAVVGGKILFGSQTGTARRLAHKLASSLRSRHGVALEVADLARYDPEDLSREPVALVLISTYEGAGGEPVPPESAAWFCRWARESSRDERYGMLHLVNVKFAVFGCGNREYGAERFNAAARALDADLARLGGERVLRRADGDEASGRMEEQFHDWADRVAERLKPKDEGATTGDEASSKGKPNVRSRRPERSSRASSRPPAAAPSLEEGPAKDDVARGGSPTSVGDGRAYDTDADEEGEDGAGEEDLSAGSEDDLDMEDIGGGGSSASGERREMVTPRLRAALTKQGYKILGSHSGVKLCRWTKAQLRGRGGCYKHSFYGIESHRCMEATPSLACANKCVFCWRHHTNPVGREWRWKMDDAETLVRSAVSEHRGMIKQMRGVPGVIPERFEEGMDPRHCALSLVGEPIMYPEIGKFVGLLHERRISTFLVTNAQFPEAIENLPPITQLYVSVDAATPETLKAIDRPLFGDYWVRRVERGEANRREIFFSAPRASPAWSSFSSPKQKKGASLSNSDCSFDGLSTAARRRHERRLKIPRGDVRSPHGIIGDHTRATRRRGVAFFFSSSSLTPPSRPFAFPSRRIASWGRSPRSGTRTSARCTA